MYLSIQPRWILELFNFNSINPTLP